MGYYQQIAQQYQQVQTAADSVGSAAAQGQPAYTYTAYPVTSLVDILFGTGQQQQPAPATVQPPAPSGLSLQVALGAIPIAHNGDVFAANYHNALRDAVIQIAGFLGDAATNQQLTLNFLPALQRDDGTAVQQWKLIDRVAHSPEGATVKGWLPLDLPDGVRVTDIAAFGSRVAGVTVTKFEVDLIRQKLADGTTTALGTLNLADQTGTFNKSQTLSGNDLDRTVDNTTYEYVLSAEVGAAAAGANIELFGLQVRCLRW